MNDLLSALDLSASGLRSQATRLRYVSENIANADTPGYHRKTTSFQDEMQAGLPTGGVTTGPVTLDQTPPERIHDPSHPMAGSDGYYEGSNVSLILEIADAREAQRSYDANLRMFEQAREMSRGLLDLLRR